MSLKDAPRSGLCGGTLVHFEQLMLFEGTVDPVEVRASLEMVSHQETGLEGAVDSWLWVSLLLPPHA